MARVAWVGYSLPHNHDCAAAALGRSSPDGASSEFSRQSLALSLQTGNNNPLTNLLALCVNPWPPPSQAGYQGAPLAGTQQGPDTLRKHVDVFNSSGGLA